MPPELGEERVTSRGLKTVKMYKYVAVEEVQAFVERCMGAVGTDPQHCTALSQVLTEAEVRGHDTHGLNRLGKSCINFLKHLS